MKTWWKSPALLLALGFVLFFAIALRVSYLDRIPGLNGDEGMHSLEVHYFLQHNPVQMWVPSGRIANPFYIYMAGVLESLFPQNAITMRLTANLSGVLFLLLAFLLMWRAGDWKVAVAGFLLFGSSPLFIAYSRVALDTCQIAMGSLLVTYFCFRKQWLALVFAVPFSLLFHPLNLLLMPMVIAAALGTFLVDGKNKQRLALVLGLLVFGGLVFLLLISSLPPDYSRFLQARQGRIADLAPFFLHYLRGLSGISVYEGFSNRPSLPIRLLHDVFAFLIMAFVFGLGSWLYLRKKNRFLLGMLWGLLLAVFLHGLTGGSVSIVPGRERYLFPLIVPTLWLLAKVACDAADYFKKAHAFAWGMTVLSLLTCTSFLGLYLMGFLTTGGGSSGHASRLYRAGGEEPIAGVISLLAQMPSEKPVEILTEGWLTQPMQYLALNHEKLNVTGILQVPAQARVQVRSTLEKCGFLAMSEGEYLHRVVASVGYRQVDLVKQFTDYAGKPLVTLVQKTGCGKSR